MIIDPLLQINLLPENPRVWIISRSSNHPVVPRVRVKQKIDIALRRETLWHQITILANRYLNLGQESPRVVTTCLGTDCLRLIKIGHGDIAAVPRCLSHLYWL